MIFIKRYKLELIESLKLWSKELVYVLREISKNYQDRYQAELEITFRGKEK